MKWLEKIRWRLANVRLSKNIGPKDFIRKDSGWEGRGVLSDFDGIHGLEILVTDITENYKEDDFGKTWLTDADEMIFRRNKKIGLYWREPRK